MAKAKDIRLRFAPSPTGQIHIGNIRTALFNWLYARHLGGTFILRVEDTDVERSVTEYEQVIFAALNWLGLDWDEGPQKGGGFSPYRQSERKHIYREYADKLLKDERAYLCYCTEDELEQMREAQRARGEMPRYDGRCRKLNSEERAAREKEGRKPVVRFKVPSGQKIMVPDLVRGNVSFDSNGFGDFVLLKSNEYPSYNFACAVDDYLMGISHVVRGEDHLSNTPRQIMIYQALDHEQPYFGHLPLILGPDKSKLSKRHGDTFIGEYRRKGYLPEAMFNFLTLLGWSPPGEEELFNRDELVAMFDINRVSKSAAVFDVDKLKWMNTHYIKNSSSERLLDLSKQYFIDAGWFNEEEIEENREWLLEAIELVKEKVSMLSEFPARLDILWGEEVRLDNEKARAELKGDHVPSLLERVKDELSNLEDFQAGNIKKAIKSAGKAEGAKGKQLFMPVRVAISGQTHGPELDQIIKLLGKDKTCKRIDSVLRQLK